RSVTDANAPPPVRHGYALRLERGERVLPPHRHSGGLIDMRRVYKPRNLPSLKSSRIISSKRSGTAIENTRASWFETYPCFSAKAARNERVEQHRNYVSESDIAPEGYSAR